MALFIFAFATVLQGCVSSEVRDYSATPTPSYQVGKVLVQVSSPDLGLQQETENAFAKELNSRGVSTVLGNYVLPPLREYSEKEIEKKIKDHGIDNIIAISVGGSAFDSSVSFYQAQSYTTGTVRSFGNTAYGSANTYTTMTPIRRVSRSTVSNAMLYEAKSGNPIWAGQAETQAGGLLFMADSTTANSLTTQFIAALEARGFVPPKKK
ncbi:hypothetical protein [Solemya velum gill symbiont]|uniref:hypothetical protein n=1 Tax=Solemya velum gill symbiont TaxID=2340 RepID=UPI00099799B2|nr:hypothetical protein [Solemya velum gill symbiont]OOZ68818.1 hypothetical protein BOW48_12360 [Solemya velum gill symbiont]